MKLDITQHLAALNQGEAAPSHITFAVGNFEITDGQIESDDETARVIAEALALPAPISEGAESEPIVEALTPLLPSPEENEYTPPLTDDLSEEDGDA